MGNSNGTRPKLQKFLGGNCTNSLTQMHPRAGLLPEKNVTFPKQVVGARAVLAVKVGGEVVADLAILAKLLNLPGLPFPPLKHGPGASSTASPGAKETCRSSGPVPGLLNQNLHLKISRQCTCAEEFEKL